MSHTWVVIGICFQFYLKYTKAQKDHSKFEIQYLKFEIRDSKFNILINQWEER
jgi:hypothetical protein